MKLLVALVALFAVIAFTHAVGLDPSIVGRRWYVGGKFDKVQQTDKTFLSVSNFAYWDGSKWGKLGDSQPDGPVYTIKMDAKFNLMIGGAFTKVGTVATGPVARYSTANSKWEAINGGGTFSAGSKVYALATDCFAFSTTTISSTRCDVYYGGHFNLTVSGATASNVARWNQEKEKVETLANANHGIQGTVYALYKKAIPAATSNSAKYLWVGGDLKSSVANAKYFARFENVETSGSETFKGLDAGMNGPVYAFEYITTIIYGQVDRLFLAGAFNFTADGIRCYRVCEYKHSTDKFIEITGVAAPNFEDGIAYDIGLNSGDIIVGGSFSKPGPKVGMIKSGQSVWDALNAAQTTTVNFDVRTIDVCTKLSKSCTSGSVAAGSTNGDIKFYDAENGKWENFGGATRSLNHTDNSPMLGSIYSYAAAGTVRVTFAVLAVLAFLGLIVV